MELLEGEEVEKCIGVMITSFLFVGWPRVVSAGYYSFAYTSLGSGVPKERSL